jgi:hypothetical protein
MSSTIILDNVIHEDYFDELQKKFLNLIDCSTYEDWFLLNTKHNFQDFCLSLINLAGSYYNLSSCGGYEFWIHNHTKPLTWHIDNDERRRDEDNIMSFPLCSIVYYLQVENLVNGELRISHNDEIQLNSMDALYEEVRNNRLYDKSDDVIIPKTNRMVLFSPGKFHTVNSFTGKRIALVINPWDVSKYKYPQHKVLDITL